MSLSKKSSSSTSNRSKRSHASKKPTTNSKSSWEYHGSEHLSEGRVSSGEDLPEPRFQSILEQARTRRKPTLEEYKAGSVEKAALFSKVVSLDSAQALTEEKNEEPSILVTGFGLRNLRSLQDVLRAQDEKRLLELYRHQKPIVEEGVVRSSEKTSRSTISSTSTRDASMKSAGTETDLSTAQSDLSAQKQQLQYLMGLQQQTAEEYRDSPEQEPQQREDDFPYSNSPSMREAQRYLRTHRIFDFFQFICAHLLGALPDNPVDFVVELLNKCLLYRTGLGEPPLLYERPHIERLFRLMDRLDSGSIERAQYTEGMTTLGVCEYDKFPPLTADDTVSKEVFVEEAYRRELVLFDDLIRERKSGKRVLREGLQRIGEDGTSGEPGGAYFIPSELFRSLKKEEKTAAAAAGRRKSSDSSCFEEG